MDTNNTDASGGENPNIFMEPPRKACLDNFFKNKRNIVLLSIGLFFIFFYILFWSAPSSFPSGSIYDLKSGQTLSTTSDNLLKSKIIKSDFWFKSFVYLFSLGKSKIIEGNYALSGKQNVFVMAWRVSHGELDIVPVKIRIPEGINSYEIADILSRNFPSFDKNVFLNIINENKFEGYLFPDTYFFLPNAKEEEIARIMNNNFNKKITPTFKVGAPTSASENLSQDIKNFGKPLSDVIKMASILEEEARTEESRKIVAGILWKRISIGMPLQVDCSFKYINGKTTATLTTEDLKINSPYNSYIYKGLPPTPISNPGLKAIKDAVNPIKTPYLYFLTDNNGNMHYSATFEEHVANKLKYLRN